ncbi:MAG: hypothetical protein SGPRY_007709, partial [Prymnesium sp.]
EAEQQAAVHEMALKYLQQRGYPSGAQLLSAEATEKPSEVKFNEMVSRDAHRKGPRCALHFPVEGSEPYQKSYVELCGWIRSRPVEQQKELSMICFPMFVHCYIALTSKPEEAARFLTVRSSALVSDRWCRRVECAQSLPAHLTGAQQCTSSQVSPRAIG